MCICALNYHLPPCIWVQIRLVQSDYFTLLVTATPMRKGLQSLTLLIPWMIWKHWNDCIFNNARPSVTSLVNTIKEEAIQWARADRARSTAGINLGCPLKCFCFHLSRPPSRIVTERLFFSMQWNTKSFHFVKKIDSLLVFLNLETFGWKVQGLM
jgi:hypothetical protein